ncbi:hypothetical protein THOB06_30193 [Vibrio rotiferianus]|nr:hypothetical protein THOG10_30193 [Vibrio rotiferianus]CAH1583178.1 hypothetical protein THOB06_30193 [Vibrio rotiferianus]
MEARLSEHSKKAQVAQILAQSSATTRPYGDRDFGRHGLVSH